MAYRELEGPENLQEAFAESVEFTWSAVVVRSAIDDPVLFERRLAMGKAVGTSYSEILYSEVSELHDAELIIGSWATKNCRQFLGFASPLPSRSFGGIKPHVDSDRIMPLALSIGLRENAVFRTQALPEAELEHPRHPKFDTDYQIDEFEQNAGDMVIIPAFPFPSLHEVEASQTRAAQLYVTNTSPISRQTLQ